MNNRRLEARNMSRRTCGSLGAAVWLILVLGVSMLWCSRGLAARPADPPPELGGNTGCSSLRIRLVAPQTPVLAREVEILASRVQERSGVNATLSGGSGCSVELDVQKGIGSEGFRIEDGLPVPCASLVTTTGGCSTASGSSCEVAPTSRVLSRPARGEEPRYPTSRSGGYILPPIFSISITSRRLSNYSAIWKTLPCGDSTSWSLTLICTIIRVSRIRRRKQR